MHRPSLTFMLGSIIIASSVAVSAQARLPGEESHVVRDASFAYYRIRDDRKETGRNGAVSSSWIPRPYAFSDLWLNGSGYKPFSERVGGGLRLDLTHFIGTAEVYRDNARKADSGTGSTVGGIVRAFYRFNDGWYFGAGAQQNKIVTSIYSKQAWRPTVGAGKDILRDEMSARVQIMYILPGTDHLNATQGPEFSLWLPSPAKNGHWFYRQTVGVYEFHQTSIPGNAGTGTRGVGTFLSFGVVYRLGSVRSR